MTGAQIAFLGLMNVPGIIVKAVGVGLLFFCGNSFANNCAGIARLGMSPHEFSSKNREGGFFSSDNRLHFAAPGRQLAQAMLEHLEVAPRNPKRVEGLSDWTAFDVHDSKLISQKAKELQDAMSTCPPGVNCYSAGLYRVGHTERVISVTDNDIEKWAKAPFVSEVPSSESVRSGDLIAVSRYGIQNLHLDHVAVFETPQVLFQKGGKESEPFGLVTLERFRRDWPQSGEHADVFPQQKIFRQNETLDQYISRHSAELPASLLKAHEELKEMEIALSQFLMAPANQPSEIYKGKISEHIALQTKIDQKAQALIDLALLNYWRREGTPEHYLWGYIQLRSISLRRSNRPD